jgi:murein tripeptide amidase MpaA
MRKTIFLKLLLSLLFLTPTLKSFSQKQKFHRVSAFIQPKLLEQLFESGLEIDHFDYQKQSVFTADLSDEDLNIFKKNNVKFVYLIKDLESNLEKYNQNVNKESQRSVKVAVTTPANFALGTYNGYYTYAEMQTILDQMRTLYPSLITAKTSLGNSIEGRSVFMVKISDNPDVDENEPEVFFNAVHHAREPMSMSQMIYFMWHILENYNSNPEIKALLNSTELYLVPCVNPDGYVYNQTTNPTGGGMWRKNRRNNGNGTFGVDLNRNYGYQWGYNNTGSSATTSSDTYRGPSAFSEPETDIIKNFCNSHQFVVSMDFHAYGNYLIYPYGYVTTNPNPELPLFQQLGAFLTAENAFVSGNASQTVNYTSNGGGDDWKYGEQTTKSKIYSFTPEVGAAADGFWPAQSKIIPYCNSTVEMNIKAIKAGSFYLRLNNSAPATVSNLNNSIGISLQNQSIKQNTYTVSLSSSSSYVTSLGSSKTFSNLAYLQNVNDSLSFSLSPSTPIGTTITFEININNGIDIQTQTVSIVYTCASVQGISATNIGLNQATINWTAIAGATSYIYNYKLASSSTWSSDSTVGVNQIILPNLATGQTYNFRVRSTSCTNYSSVFNFTTLSPCTNPTANSVSAITNSTATVNWAAVSGAQNYTVEYKTSSASTWTVLSNTAAVSISLSGLTAGTLYDYRIRTNCSSGSSTYTTGQFTTSNSLSYCVSKGTNQNFMWTDLVQIGTINRVSGKDAGYYNGSSLSTNAVRGTSQTITVSNGFTSTNYRMYWRIFVDYNNNGVFTDAGETVLSFQTTGAGNTARSFVIPAGTSVGSKKIRVSSKYSAYATSCETFTYGEVEDFTINVVASANKGVLSALANNTTISSFEESYLKLGNQSDIKVYPNPINDYALVNFTNRISENAVVRLYDSNGKELSKQSYAINDQEILLGTLELKKGIYYLKVIDKDKTKLVRLVKE